MLFENIRELYRLYKKPINLTILIVAISFFVYIFTTYKIVIFTSNTQQDNVKVYGYTIANIGSNTQKPTELSRSSVNIIPRSVNYFEASSGDTATIIGEQKLPFYIPFQSLNITLSSQKKLEKKYTGPFNCLAGDEQHIRSYSCTNPNHVFNYETSTLPWSNESTTTVKDERSLVHYKKGLLGLRHLAGLRYDKPLVYTDLTTNTKTYYPIPEEIAADVLNISSITPSDTNPNILLVASHRAKTFYIINIATNTIVKKINYPKEFEEDNSISCKVLNGEAICYIGKAVKSLDSAEVDASAEQKYLSKKSTIYRFTLEDSNTQVDAQILNENYYIKEIYTTSNGILYGLSDDNVLLKISEDGTSNIIARDVQSVGVADTLFFSRSNQLYKFEEKTTTSSLVFNTEDSISKVQSFDDNIYVSMFGTDSANQTTTNLYTFKLSNEDVDNNKPRSIISLNKLPYIYSVDYNNKDIFVKLKLPIISDKSSGNILFNPKLRQEYIQRTEAEINKLPIEKASYRILYYPN